MNKEDFIQEVKVENLNEQIETSDEIGTIKERAFASGWNACQREILNNIDKAFPNKDESQCNWAIVYEYARSMEDYLEDNDEEELKACIERVKEIAVDNGGNKIDQIATYVKKDNERDRGEIIESCIRIVEYSDWLLARTLDIEKREKLHSIALEATKVLRKLVNTPTGEL